MKYLLELFGAIPLSTVIAFIAAIVFIIVTCVKVYKIIVQYHDKKEEKDKMLFQISDDIKELKSHQLEMKQDIAELTIMQQKTSKRQYEIEKQTRERTLNELRDRLTQSYRYYTDEQKNPLLAWSEMEKEVFDRLFEDYENLGGNGYMHSNVQPAMMALEVVSMNDRIRYAELMKSRKG